MNIALTEQEYFSFGNGILTNSKLKDYKKDQQFFCQKHIEGSIEARTTDPMIVGSAVDCWISAGRKAFEERYSIFPKGKNRDTQDPNYPYHLTENMFEQVREIAEKVEQQPAYKDLADFECQKILCKDMEINPFFNRVGGIPDWIKINKDHAIIVDYKTSFTIDRDKYYYVCRDQGYFFQQGMYQLLVKWLYPEIRTIESRHLVTEKDPEKIFKTRTFLLDQTEIEMTKTEIRSLIEQVSQQTKIEDYKPDWALWEEMETVKNPKKEEEDIDIEL